jgi:hypothetical protein
MNSHETLTRQLEGSIKLQSAVRESNNLAAENAFLCNQIMEALRLFENRFLSDPSQFAPGEFEWYKDAAIEMKSRYGRPEITAKVSDYLFSSITGTEL